MRLPKTVKDKRLTWEETYRETTREKEDWSDLDATVADGIEHGETFQRIPRPPTQ